MISHLIELEKIMQKYCISHEDICLLGSTILAIDGIKDNQDIEFVLRPKARDILLSKYNDLNINHYSGVIKFSDVIECTEEIYNMFGINDDALFCEPYSIKSGKYRVNSMSLYIAQKVVQNRNKDHRLIEMVKATKQWTDEIEQKTNEYVEIAKQNGWEVSGIKPELTWENLFRTNKKMYIFGTGIIGKRIYKRIVEQYDEEKIVGFVVSERVGDEERLYGKRVYKLEEVKNRENVILVAVTIQKMKSNMQLLRKYGLNNLVQAYQFLD